MKYFPKNYAVLLCFVVRFIKAKSGYFIGFFRLCADWIGVHHAGMRLCPCGVCRWLED